MCAAEEDERANRDQDRDCHGGKRANGARANPARARRAEAATDRAFGLGVCALGLLPEVVQEAGGRLDFCQLSVQLRADALDHLLVTQHGGPRWEDHGCSRGARPAARASGLALARCAT